MILELWTFYFTFIFKWILRKLWIIRKLSGLSFLATNLTLDNSTVPNCPDEIYLVITHRPKRWPMTEFRTSKLALQAPRSISTNWVWAMRDSLPWPMLQKITHSPIGEQHQFLCIDRHLLLSILSWDSPIR